MCLYNPLDKFYKSIIGAVPENEQVTFRVKGNFDSVVLLLKKDGEYPCFYKMDKKTNYFELNLKLTVGLYFYHFILSNNQYISLNAKYIGEISDRFNDFQLTVYSKDYVVPEWIYGGVIYQIFPDRFFRAEEKKYLTDYKVFHDNWNDIPIYKPNKDGKILNNDFFGGDIQGIIKKLDYLKELGVTVIYLNPIFKAYSNHRYDTGDYMQIDPLLGDENDFKELIEKSKNLGIRIILDGVFNHTGDDSVYFNKYGRYDSIGAFQDKDSPYYSWYNFINYPKEYESWWGIETLPAINETNEDYVNFITDKCGVIERYTKLGVGGWRLDVVDELPSEFVKKIRIALKNNNKDGILIGEVWEDASNKISYGKRREYLQGNELDSAMNYPLKDAIINFVKSGSVDRLSYVIKEQIDHYPHIALHAMMNLLSTHDTMRLLTVLGGEDPSTMTKDQMAEYKIPEQTLVDAIVKLKIATLLQFTLCGVPSIYYGDEIGMEGYSDPLNRRTYTWNERNDDIYSWFKFLTGLRDEYSALSKGDFEEIYAANGTYIFKRFDDFSQLLVGVNLSNKEKTFKYEGCLFDLVTKKEYDNNFILYPNSCCILIKKL